MGKWPVCIRPIENRDTQNIVKWRNAPEVSQFFIDRRLLTPQGHKEWLEKRVSTGEVAQFIIELNEAPVGSVYLRDIDLNNQKAEYGIFIGEERALGQGVGTKAGLLCLQYGFETLKLNRIFLRVFAENQRAVRSYEKIGFSCEGIFRQEVCIKGRFHDILYMAMLHQEWSARDKAEK